MVLILTNTNTVPTSLVQDVQRPLPIYQVTFVDPSVLLLIFLCHSSSLMSHIHLHWVITFILIKMKPTDFSKQVVCLRCWKFKFYKMISVRYFCSIAGCFWLGGFMAIMKCSHCRHLGSPQVAKSVNILGSWEFKKTREASRPLLTMELGLV